MLASISTAQFIGSLISVGFFVFVGVYLLWMWPIEVRRKVQSGKLTEVQGQEKLRKSNPKLGYIGFLVALAQLIIVLVQWFSPTYPIDEANGPSAK